MYDVKVMRSTFDMSIEIANQEAALRWRHRSLKIFSLDSTAKITPKYKFCHKIYWISNFGALWTHSGPLCVATWFDMYVQYCVRVYARSRRLQSNAESAKTFNLSLSTPHYDFFLLKRKRKKLLKEEKGGKDVRCLSNLAVVPGFFLV